jgi:hypothetical protein
VMGYPKNALHPAATAPRTIASFPLSNRRMNRLPIQYLEIMLNPGQETYVRFDDASSWCSYAAGSFFSGFRTRTVIAPISGHT